MSFERCNLSDIDTRPFQPIDRLARTEADANRKQHTLFATPPLTSVRELLLNLCCYLKDFITNTVKRNKILIRQLPEGYSNYY